MGWVLHLVVNLVFVYVFVLIVWNRGGIWDDDVSRRTDFHLVIKFHVSVTPFQV